MEAAIISPGETYLKLISLLNDVELSPMALAGVQVGPMWVAVNVRKIKAGRCNRRSKSVVVSEDTVK